jgi:signal transduction histidine kinase/ligand-binding sensor domain-containing protein/DNA-binding response OmpR family regulator
MYKSFLTLKVILSLALIWSGISVCAQTPNADKHISNAQDIHFNVVTRSQDDIGSVIAGMTQDTQGFLWLATQNGLYKYDGYQYTSYHHEPLNPNSLANDDIWSVAADKAGYIWLAPVGTGLDRLDPATGTFTHFHHNNNDASSLGCDTVMAIIQDHEGVLWIGTFNGLDKYDTKSNKFLHYRYNANDESSLSCNLVRAIYEDKEGTIWVGTGTPFQGYDSCGGLNKLNKETGKFTRYLHDEKDPHSLIDNRVRAIYEDSRGIFWVGTAGDGLHTMDRVKGTFERHLYDPVHPDKLSRPPVEHTFFSVADHITFITEDNKGRIWIGTLEGGINVYDPSTQKVSYYGADKNSKEKIKNNDFLTGFKTRDNVIWISTYGTTLYKIVPYENILPHTRIGKEGRCFVEDDAHTLWIGTEKGLIHKTNGKEEHFLIDKDSSSSANKIHWIEKDNDKFWLATSHGLRLFNIFTKTFSGYFHQPGNVNSLISDQVTVVKKITDNKFWIGTNNGLDLMDTKSQTFAHFQNKLKDTASISDNGVWTISMDKKQNLWVGTYKGLNRLDTRTGHFKRYLNQSAIRSIIEDGEGNLWCGTTGGLFKYDKENDNFSIFTDELDIISRSLPVYWITEDLQQNLWLNTRKGIIGLSKERSSAVLYGKNQGVSGLVLGPFGYTRQSGEVLYGDSSGYFNFMPSLLQQNVLPPSVSINNFLLNNVPVQPSTQGILSVPLVQTKEIRLPYNQNTFSFEFSTTDFISDPEDIRLLYMLQNYDNAWRKAGDEKAAYYFNLPPGNYIFKVKVFNAAGVAAEKDISIIITPPWWNTWWAYIAYLVLIIVIGRAYFKFTVNRAKLKSQLLFEQNEAKRAKELDNLKTQLYTNITHEFRTPLTVILGMAHQIESKPDEYLKSGTNMIIRNGESLLKLVNELLDLSKLESGKMSLQLVQGDVVIFLRYIIESFHSLAESQKKQLHFLSEIDSLTVAYDPEKMRQIVANLLSNALKFTPEKGNVYISVNENKLVDKEEQSSLIIKVKDTGIGISEEEMLYIFDRFYQSDNSHTRKAEGTGIGLALTRELVKLMEGEISVKSPSTGANKGSEFTVVLPFKRLPIAEQVITHPELKLIPQQKINTTGIKNEIIEETANTEKPIILLVEDNADVVAYTASCLPPYRLAVGKDGMEGLEIAIDVIPDLIITDVMMPVMDGFELCNKLRSDQRTSHIPIIMLTAKADMASKMEGLERGADVYLEKPFNREELLLRIKKLLELRKQLQQYYLKKAGLIDKPVTTIPTPVDDKMEDAFVKKVRESVEAHLADFNFTVEELCKYVFMSHSQLHRKLEALTGCSPNKFIRIIRLNKAKQLLKKRDNSITSIAFECGYNDPGYFSRVFKQENNITPQEWRVEHKKELQ